MIVRDKIDSPCLRVQSVYSLFIMENGYIQLTLGGPEIKCLLQEGMSVKGSLLAKPLELAHPDTSLAWRTLCTVVVVTVLMWGVVAHVPGQEQMKCLPVSDIRVPGFLNPLNLPRFCMVTRFHLPYIHLPRW